MFGKKLLLEEISLYFCPVACQFSNQQLKPFLRKAVYKRVKITTSKCISITLLTGTW